MALLEKEYCNMTISISKALNPIEAALKVKHARATIIGTFRLKGAQSFWSIVLRQPLMDNRFTAWKFCHLLHKILREGHPLCIQHSQRHKKMLIELGKLWGHLTDGYGICIKNYTKLLVTKLEFHERNPRFPGNLSLTKEEFEDIGQNDINYYFQIGVEMFDYLDDIITLQALIFESISKFRMNSMTEAGQCRLAPVIPLIQDSNPLYDFTVRLMFKLHSHLPNDILVGHRERFRSIFTQLKNFYEQVRPLQYFQGLIQVPKLPDTPPNFSSHIDFGSYIPPVVVVPQEPDPPESTTESVVDNLVDMSVPDSPVITQSNGDGITSPIFRKEPPPPPPQINFERLLCERDELIRELQMEIERLSRCLKAQAITTREQLNERDEQISKLNDQLVGIQEELTNMRIMKEELELKAQFAPTLQQKVIAEEEKAKVTEEKFQKIKAMYTQIRDEHVNLLRQHGEATKQLTLLKKESADIVTEKELLKVQLEEFQEKQQKTNEELQKTLEASKHDQKLSENYEKLSISYEQMKQKYDNLQADKSAEISELHTKIHTLETNMEESNKIKEETNQIINKLQNDMKIMKTTEETSSKLLMEKKEELENLRTKFEEEERKYKMMYAMLERIKNEKNSIECELQDILLQQSELEEKYNSALQTITQLESSLRDCKINGETAIRALLETSIKSAKKLAIRAMNENEFTHAVGTSSYFMMIAEELQEVLKELEIVYEKYIEDNSCVEGLTRKSVLTGHLLATIQIQGMTICNTSSDIECGERIADEIKKFSTDIMELFEFLYQLSESKKVSITIGKIKENLTRITNMIHDLSKKSENSGQIGDLIETELASMDKAIEEAAAKIVEMLSNSRASDSGIKLEVNEKILDACTNLMQAIRILVQKSRILQAEIVSLGKGTASVKEFYKRNHQWTEGLISAAKSVAQGANLLVTAANKTVTGEIKHHLDLVVAAQEIAASTAQLVVASRVKAPRESQNLQALSNASRNVTQATGAVVATAKNCSQQLEDSQDIDLTKLTVHQAKTLEMEIQVKVLELEQALQMERLKLSAFRRKNYQNSDEKI